MPPALNTLGLFYFKTGQYIVKLSHCLLNQLSRLKLFGSNPSDYATSLNNLATFVEMGNYKQAEPLHLKVIDIDKNNWCKQS